MFKMLILVVTGYIRETVALNISIVPVSSAAPDPNHYLIEQWLVFEVSLSLILTCGQAGNYTNNTSMGCLILQKPQSIAILFLLALAF